MQLLGARNPDHAFKVLFVGYPGEDQMLDALQGEVFKAWLPATADKPPGREWEGDNRRWDQILEPWTLAVHSGDRITRTYEDSLQLSDGGEPRPGWRERLRRWLKV